MKKLILSVLVLTLCVVFASCECEHVFSEWEVQTESTCDVAGIEVRTCSECGVKQEKELALLEHTFGEWTVSKEATCTEKGEEKSTCSVCQCVQTRETDMIEHNYGEWVVSKEATCTSDGIKTSSCIACEALIEETVPALLHNWLDATCTTPKTCSLCKLTEGSAIGHSWSLATCTEATKCFNCGIKQGSALGHQYTNGICVRCNAKDQNYVEYGSVSGTITYKYNDFVGHRGDTGSIVYLVHEKDVIQAKVSLPHSMAWGWKTDLPKGVYVTEVSGNGNYSFDRIPTGKYTVIVISENTNPNPDYVDGLLSWGLIYNNFSDENKEKALSTAEFHKMKWKSIEVFANQTTNFSHDFGITYW